MATYSDSMTGYADFESTGHYFAWAMMASVVIASTALYAGSGHLPWLILSASDLAFAAMAGYVGFGLALIMGIAATGSLLITHRAKTSIVISEAGVSERRHGRDRFLAREEILGMAEMPRGAMPRGSIMLITNDRRHRIVVPQSLAHYGDCLRELQQMGIAMLPPIRRTRQQTIAGWLLQFFAVAEMTFVIRALHSPVLGGYSLLVLIAGILLIAFTLWGTVKLRSYLPSPKIPAIRARNF